MNQGFQEQATPFVGPNESLAPSPPRTDIGELAVELGYAQPGAVLHTRLIARRAGESLHNTLLAEGLIDEAQRIELLSQIWGVGRVDLDASPPDAELLKDYSVYDMLRIGFMPWVGLGGVRIFALSDPERTEEVLQLNHPDGVKPAISLAPRSMIEAQLTAHFDPLLESRAMTLCPPRYSCRNWGGGRHVWLGLGTGFSLISAFLLWPGVSLTLALIVIALGNTLTLMIRCVALIAVARRPLPAEDPDPPGKLRDPPTVTVLLPLLREGPVLKRLIDALNALDYPAVRLDLIALAEEQDVETRETLAALDLPPNLRVLTVPHGTLRTKPRAMNYALPFCRGEIIGIYDAEDRPEPDQILRVVGHLREAPEDVACVQARLDFYNPNQNWLTRCFTLEYATWFRVLLRGVEALRLPLPLGGTSVFFRRAALERVGGWDAHNVTEDAELGMRLARFGYRCEMIASTTYEEANPSLPNWLRQRSRWLKGYCITWATHMRRPGALWGDLGPRGFLGFHAILLGAIVAYLALPLFWAMTIATVAGLTVPAMEAVPKPLWLILVVSLPLGQAVMLTAVGVALRARRSRWLWPWVFTLPFYWPLGAMAAWLAVFELFTAPFHWHKTEHGLADTSDVEHS
ncbi:glycosyltransferase family 2 protein [Pontivivens ytuae]|uniref:Glycosyltransferase n=1 Tax=Pontivivens ytuae TaxID=2789856 RepID=A0A7S9QCY5_9RHOB|nr:glycosyltransferase [Pontivivens ytuae]QPH53571.1 glycosyltransferase [Pontivivens ytuae]